jgi:hypothetical protein
VDAAAGGIEHLHLLARRQPGEVAGQLVHDARLVPDPGGVRGLGPFLAE